MNPKPRADRPAVGRRGAGGFTLLELLVALALAVTAFSIVWGVFATTIDAWRRGGDLLDRLHRGEFVFDRLEATLRSAAWYSSSPERYGFRLESSGGEEDAEDTFSWVTVSDAFEPRASARSQGMRRVIVRMAEDKDGKPALAVVAQHVLADPDAMKEPEEEPLAVIPEILGVRCEVYEEEDKEWTREWTETNSLPERVQVTLTLEPVRKGDKPVLLQRIIPLPTARASTLPLPGGRAGAPSPQPGAPPPGLNQQGQRPAPGPAGTPAPPPMPRPRGGPQ
jgi:prepilin-type N-terminal cleavage/methylation domain-containing protein